MTYVPLGEDIDIGDTFESDLTLASPAGNGELVFRLEKPDGTLAALWTLGSNNQIQVLSGNKYHVEFTVNMKGIWYWAWTVTGTQPSKSQGWFRVLSDLIGHRAA